jgi:3-methyladenine DNA glycosylase AlkD
MSKTISPTQLAKMATFKLKSSADPKTAAQSRSFFKEDEKISVYGIKIPKLREIEKGLFKEVKNRWTAVDAAEFCNILISDPYLESKTLGIFLLTRFHKTFDTGLIQKVQGWLSNNHCSNWATTDALSTLVVTPLIRRFPDLIPKIKNWTESRNLWVRRAAAVSLVQLARKGQHLETAYEIAESLFNDDEDLIHKATGWLLREAGKTDPNRLETFLLKHGGQIPRTALRYAIERFPEEKRKIILADTKRT